MKKLGGEAGRRILSLEQRLVEQQGASRAGLLLQAEDEVPEVDSRDPLTQLLAGRGGGGCRRGARARAGGRLGGERVQIKPKCCVKSQTAILTKHVRGQPISGLLLEREEGTLLRRRMGRKRRRRKRSRGKRRRWSLQTTWW